MVTALAAGRTKVRIRPVSYDPEGNEVVCEAETEVIVAEKAPAYLEMHRVYNPNSGEHHYTSDTVEKDTLVSLGWKYEGIGWKAPGKSETPVYRLYNKNGGEHHYTMDKVERDALINKYHWTDEGIGWYSDDAKGVTIYREYNPNAFACNHNYTADTKEHDALINKYGWNDEGTAWFGLK